MNIQKLDEDLFVAPQIKVQDIAVLKALGISSIIVARPERETSDQPPIEQIKKAADAMGIDVDQIPILPNQITDEQTAAFSKHLNKQEGSILAYCRSGKRACILWALHSASRGRSVDDILDATQSVGHELSALRPRLESLATDPIV